MKKKKKDKTFAKYFVIATNYIYTLTAPIILMLAIYHVITKYVIHRSSKTLLVTMLLLGIIAGYWTLFKEIKGKK